MKSFFIQSSEEAKEDLDNLFYVITTKYKTPKTAVKYIQELLERIEELNKTAKIYQIQNRRSLQQYEINVRRINYKRMAIIYSVHDDLVYIHRVIPQSHITGL